MVLTLDINTVMSTGSHTTSFVKCYLPTPFPLPYYVYWLAHDIIRELLFTNSLPATLHTQASKVWPSTKDTASKTDLTFSERSRKQSSHWTMRCVCWHRCMICVGIWSHIGTGDLYLFLWYHELQSFVHYSYSWKPQPPPHPTSPTSNSIWIP